MILRQALRANQDVQAAFVGAGGKTTAMFQLARQFEPPVLVSASTHLTVEQLSLADRHVTVRSPADVRSALEDLPDLVVGFTGPAGTDGRTGGLDRASLYILHEYARQHHIPLLFEADGSRRLPLKAPAEHEPAIPYWTHLVVVVAGLSGLGRPLHENTIHRPERFARIAELSPGDRVTPAAVVEVLSSSEGGLKNIPPEARKVVLLNQADGEALQRTAANMAEPLLVSYDAVLVAALQNEAEPVAQAIETTAAIILAGGGSERFGRTKFLLDWHGEPFLRKIARTALEAKLDPVVVVLGAVVAPAIESLQGLSVDYALNLNWREGQSTSVHGGITALSKNAGAAVFLLADQPQVTPELLRTLVDAHNRSLSPLVAPFVGDRRANPVLFDRVTFDDLLALQGDIGGRAVFEKHAMQRLPWQDDSLLLDVDTPEDYQQLLERFRKPRAG